MAAGAARHMDGPRGGVKRLGSHRPLAAAALALALGVPPATAQTDPEAIASALATVTELEFNFSNPGARSLAMGGAFLGRADDASAAYANPAGLVELTRPEVSVELRNWNFTAKIGLPSLEAGEVIPAGEAELETEGILFASYVYPRDRWTVAAYRFALAGYDLRGELASLDTELITYGIAGAWRFDNGLSLGAVLVRNEASIEIVVPCLGEACDGLLLSRADDTTLVGNIGFLWWINERWSVGGVYREGPEFGLVTSATLVEGSQGRVSEAQAFKVPDVLGVGFGVRPNSRLVLNLDLVRVRYSQGPEAFGLRSVPTPTGATLGTIDIDDVDEVHFGAEYSFWNVKGAPALRFGAWWDPAHKIRFMPAAGLDTTPPPQGASEAEAARVFAERFDGGNDRLHVSAGFGFVIGRRFQLDAGIDVSDQTESLSVSTLVRF